MNLKDILSQVSVTTLLLVFLFFCGTLYIISYWSTFNFDITNYIELFDIPKSFVFPLATGLGVAFLSLLAQAVIKVSGDEEPLPRTAENINMRLLRKWSWINSNSLALVSLIGCMLFYEPHQEWIVIVVGFTLIGWGFRKMNRNEYVVKLIPFKRARFFFSVLITFIPVYCVCKGKLDGIAVWKNRHYYSVAHVVYVERLPGNDDVVGKKLLGKLGSCIIITDSANASIMVLNLEKVQLVKYRLMQSPNLFGR